MKIRHAINNVSVVLVAILGVLVANTLTTGPTLPEVPPEWLGDFQQQIMGMECQA